MRRLPPTPRQYAIENFIVQFIKEHGYSPSIRELGGQFGVSDPAMKGLLDRLEQRGRIRREPGMPRTLQVVSE